MVGRLRDYSVRALATSMRMNDESAHEGRVCARRDEVANACPSQDATEPSQGQFSFDNAEAIVELAQNNSQLIRGMTVSQLLLLQQDPLSCYNKNALGCEADITTQATPAFGTASCPAGSRTGPGTRTR